MKRTALLIGLLGAVMMFWTAECFANDHFANRRRELERARARQGDYITVKRPWGGPTTHSNWWTTERVPKHPRRHSGRVYVMPYYVPSYNNYYYRYYPNQYYYFTPFSGPYFGAFR